CMTGTRRRLWGIFLRRRKGITKKRHREFTGRRSIRREWRYRWCRRGRGNRRDRRIVPRFLRSGTAEGAVPPVGMTGCLDEGEITGYRENTGTTFFRG